MPARAAGAYRGKDQQIFLSADTAALRTNVRSYSRLSLPSSDQQPGDRDAAAADAHTAGVRTPTRPMKSVAAVEPKLMYA